MTHQFQLSLAQRSQRFVGLVLGFWMTLAPVALAKYVPPKKASAPKTTSTTITRGGCAANASGQLATLVPYSHVGLTTAKRPTFAWYVPNREAYPLEFRLFRSNGQRLYKTQMQSQPGVMQFSLPVEQPELPPGEYIWQVALQCDRFFPPVVVSAQMQVVQPSPELEQQLAAEPNAPKRANLYAENSLWYDALATALKNAGTPENQSVLLDLFNFLVATDTQMLKQWSDRLLQPRATQSTPQTPR
ncbi:MULTISPECIES: DUF928 domain-containing protein [Trichocoleus]|uniref:DUF928 domain-containing protein n=1 Tax=Trichocoleus desertorum GB2-A4 TaxID=2933944 RepID=A0ABV0JFP7_9CYAN|nr:DUF928 domain-containing protein [Trichocoleus sp. FACHB-46]MBD1860059.1 DUF928 domain-containing protein [Trichocoleus sp. FACHB-46]